MVTVNCQCTRRRHENASTNQSSGALRVPLASLKDPNLAHSAAKVSALDEEPVYRNASIYVRACVCMCAARVCRCVCMCELVHHYV
jgi:hypothetical protein